MKKMGDKTSSRAIPSPTKMSPSAADAAAAWLDSGWTGVSPSAALRAEAARLRAEILVSLHVDLAEDAMGVGL